MGEEPKNRGVKYEFDGTKRIIKLLTDEELDVVDLYSRWKDWLMADINARFHLAFRYEDGPERGRDIEFILCNGWRIIPFGEDRELMVCGKLVTEEGENPFILTDEKNIRINNKTTKN